MKPADELADLWSSSPLNMQAIEKMDVSSWKTYQMVYFLDRVLAKSPLPPGKKKSCVKPELNPTKFKFPKAVTFNS